MAHSDDTSGNESKTAATSPQSEIGIIYEGKINGDLENIANQDVLLSNGVSANIEVNVPDDYIRVSGDNGEEQEFSLSNLREMVNSGSENQDGQLIREKRKIKKPNACQVATTLAGVGHSALWGLALGGPGGAAAGAAAGLFWGGVGTQC